MRLRYEPAIYPLLEWIAYSTAINPFVDGSPPSLPTFLYEPLDFDHVAQPVRLRPPCEGQTSSQRRGILLAILGGFLLAGHTQAHSVNHHGESVEWCL